MKAVIFGATGGTGRELVKLCLEKRFEVTAFVRDPTKITDEKVKSVKGDARNPAEVEEAVKGNEVVFSCIGVKPGQKPINSISTANIISAMHKEKIKRIIVESAYGVGKTRKKGIYAKLLWTVINPLIKDKEEMEKMIESSGLEWTIIQPPILTNDPLTGKYQFGENTPVNGFAKISRADVAHLMLKVAEEGTTIKQNVIITK